MAYYFPRGQRSYYKPLVTFNVIRRHKQLFRQVGLSHIKMALTKAQCKEIFDKFAGPDGLLTPHELKNAIMNLSGSSKLSNNDLDKIVVECFQGMDMNGDQKITLEEFISDMTKPARVKKLEETFKKWDKDGSGYLSRAELKAAIMETMDEETAEAICDQINDDHITFDEFMGLCN